MTTLTPEDVAALAGGEAAEELACPECGRTFESQAALNGHLSAHRGKAKGRAQASRQRAANKPPPATGIDAAAKTIVNKAIANTQFIGGVVMIVAPHLGLAISGLRDPQTQKIIVRSRAEIAGGILLSNIAAAQTPEELQRAAQIVELLRRFNTIFEYTALGDVVGSLAIAAAVDARLIPPTYKVKIGALELPIVESTIGDVVAELEAQGLYDEQMVEPTSPDGTSPEGAEVIAGDVTAT